MWERRHRCSCFFSDCTYVADSKPSPWTWCWDIPHRNMMEGEGAPLVDPTWNALAARRTALSLWSSPWGYTCHSCEPACSPPTHSAWVACYFIAIAIYFTSETTGRLRLYRTINPQPITKAYVNSGKLEKCSNQRTSNKGDIPAK